MLRIAGAAFALLVGASGCTVYTIATPSVQGRAFIVRDGSSFWNCDATSGAPICYQTKRQFTPQPPAK